MRAEFELWKTQKGFRGYVRLGKLVSYECVIKDGEVLVRNNGRWIRFGRYYELKARAFAGIIWTPGSTYYVLRNGDRFKAI